jgi:hypothetical protein
MKTLLGLGAMVLVLLANSPAAAECDPPITDRYVLACCLGVCIPGVSCPPCFWGDPHQSRAGDGSNEPADAGRLRFEPISAKYASATSIAATEVDLS